MLARTSFASTLTLVLIVLRLAGVVTWSWWIVLSPLLVTIVLFVVINAIMARNAPRLTHGE